MSDQKRPAVPESREDLRAVLSAVELVPVSRLRPADSPRSTVEDVHHARTLAQSGAVLPPIIVHRPSMRVMDGTHRLRALTERGEEWIRVRFFDGSEQDAFLIAVRENTRHGLPLPLHDRAAAAVRLIGSHGHLSDRAIGEAAGLSPKTVGAIRRSAQEAAPQHAGRVGRDGRHRPLNSAQGRMLAGRLITEMPSASLRQIARLAGVSPGTVRDVRARIARGDDPLPPAVRRRRRTAGEGPEPGTAGGSSAEVPDCLRSGAASEPAGGPAPPRITARHAQPATHRTDAVVAAAPPGLLADPSLKYTENGRLLLRLLSSSLIPAQRWDALYDAVPGHRIALTAEAARACADAWRQFAERLESAGCATDDARRLHTTFAA